MYMWIGLINNGAERRVTKLANNTNKVKLKLGFFLLKNLMSRELEKDITLLQCC